MAANNKTTESLRHALTNKNKPEGLIPVNCQWPLGHNKPCPAVRCIGERYCSKIEESRNCLYGE